MFLLFIVNLELYCFFGGFRRYEDRLFILLLMGNVLVCVVWRIGLLIFYRV